MEKEWLEDNEKNSKKKTIISAIFVVALLVIVGGIAVAAFTTTLTSNDNTVNTGRISMSYSEPSNALVLENALPMEDSEGKQQSKFFEFTVSTHATTNANDDTGITIPYEINISDLTIDGGYQQLTKSFVKVNLVKVDGTTETEVVTPTLLSNMSSSTLREGATRVYKTSDTHKNNSAAKVTTYRLRAWLDKSFDATSDKTYQYKFSVNVNSQVNAVGVEYPAEPTLLKTAILGDNNSNVVSSGYGLYVSTETNDGSPTYYYRGNVENNYVQLGALRLPVEGQCLVKDEYIGYTMTSGKPLEKNSFTSVVSEEGCNSVSLCQYDSFSAIMPSSLCASYDDGSYGKYLGESNHGVYTEWVPETTVSIPLMWRVVRVNEDGTIKIVHEASPSLENYEFSGGRIKMYYSDTDSEEYVKWGIDDWYTTNLISYDNIVATTNFCESAKVRPNDDGYGQYTSENAVMEKISNYTPNFKCPLDGNGKQYVNAKAGLLTVDEVLMAGAQESYLSSTGALTMSTAGIYYDDDEGTRNIWWTLDSGNLSTFQYGAFKASQDIVISLKADVTVTGTGEAGSPWVVQTN